MGARLRVFRFMRICVCPFCLLSNRYQIVIILLSIWLDTEGVGVLCCSCEVVGGSQIRGKNMKKLLLGDKQMETLEECINLALMCCEGLDEYKSDFRRYSDLRDKITHELAK